MELLFQEHDAELAEVVRVNRFRNFNSEWLQITFSTPHDKGELKLPEIMSNQIVKDEDHFENYSTKYGLVFASSLLKDTEGWFGIPRQIMN